MAAVVVPDAAAMLVQVRVRAHCRVSSGWHGVTFYGFSQDAEGDTFTTTAKRAARLIELDVVEIVGQG